MNLDNNIVRLILRAIVGGYIGFLGYQLISNVSAGNLSEADAANSGLFLAAGIALCLIGAGFIGYAVVTYLKNRPKE